MASDGHKGGSHEDSDGLTYEEGYIKGRAQAEKRLKGQIDFLIREREGFIKDMKELTKEVAHLRRTTSDTGAIAP